LIAVKAVPAGLTRLAAPFSNGAPQTPGDAPDA